MIMNPIHIYLPRSLIIESAWLENSQTDLEFADLKQSAITCYLGSRPLQLFVFNNLPLDTSIVEYIFCQTAEYKRVFFSILFTIHL